MRLTPSFSAAATGSSEHAFENRIAEFSRHSENVAKRSWSTLFARRKSRSRAIRPVRFAFLCECFVLRRVAVARLQAAEEAGKKILPLPNSEGSAAQSTTFPARPTKAAGEISSLYW